MNRSESMIELRYVLVAETGFYCNSPTDPHLLKSIVRTVLE